MRTDRDQPAVGAVGRFSQSIRARAVRRCGELLKRFDARPANAAKQTDATGGLISQRKAAERAGISERQQLTAVRVANEPEPEFSRQVQSESPPTITALAQQGVKPPSARPGDVRRVRVS